MSSEHAAIVQGDRSVLLEVAHPAYDRARQLLGRFAEIEKSPEHVHTYRISDLSLWNAAASGMTSEAVLSALREVSRFELPSHLEREVHDVMARYGMCSLHVVSDEPARLRLAVREPFVRERLAGDKRLRDMLLPCPDGFLLDIVQRGAIKQALLRLGFPVSDHAGLKEGAKLEIGLKAERFTPYPYQELAASAFVENGGHGVVVLPCGAGKTIVAMLAMRALSTHTLVVTTGREACSQWRRELLDKTSLAETTVRVFDSARAQVAPVTVVSYNMVARKGGGGPTGHVHFDRLAREPWGLVVYDEVHLLPAPVLMPKVGNLRRGADEIVAKLQNRKVCDALSEAIEYFDDDDDDDDLTAVMEVIDQVPDTAEPAAPAALATAITSSEQPAFRHARTLRKVVLADQPRAGSLSVQGPVAVQKLLAQSAATAGPAHVQLAAGRVLSLLVESLAQRGREQVVHGIELRSMEARVIKLVDVVAAQPAPVGSL